MNKDSTRKIEFSLLDFGLRDSSMNSMAIIEDVLDYASLADRLGYKRIWLTEHHISDSLAAWYNPLPILPLIAGMTHKIIVGIAGSQMSIHNPYHIATNYKLLANLFPVRIDLGLATGNMANSLQGAYATERFTAHEKRMQVVRLLQEEDRLVAENECIIPPFKGIIPDIWLLGTNYNLLEEVIDHKLNFSRSLFHGEDLHYHREELEEFKEKFYLKHRQDPCITLALSGCCHYTDKKARQVAENSNYKGIRNINVCGSAERFRDTILMYQEQYGYNEFTFLNIARTPKDRKIGIKLIQKAFSL